jgi:hypothetical protein
MINYIHQIKGAPVFGCILLALLGQTSAQSVLESSGPQRITQDDAVVENLHITASGEHGILVQDAQGVTIRNCKIDFTGNCRGIFFRNAPDLVIENCEITYTDAPAAGPLPSTDRNAIEGEHSDNPTISRVRMRDASTGIYLRHCDNPTTQYLEGYNFRGPFPRGQLIQWHICRNGTLEDFSVVNDRDISWTEDNINSYRGGGQVIRRGLIVGNNSPSGVGVLFEDQHEGDATGIMGGTVEDVDMIGMGNGVGSGADGANNIDFVRIRAKDNVCGDLGQGRGGPSSNALIFSGFGGGYDLEVIDATLWNLCNPGNIFWPGDAFTTRDYVMEDFTPRDPVELVFPWEEPLSIKIPPARENEEREGMRKLFPTGAGMVLFITVPDGHKRFHDLKGRLLPYYRAPANLKAGSTNLTD